MSKTSNVFERISETLIWLAGVEVGEVPEDGGISDRDVCKSTLMKLML
jgi:hypothetical protein